jgi:hypothetical protein
MNKPAYEVHNPSFNDINLECQIAFGINDWCAEGADGHPFFGRTKAEAEKIRADYADAEWEDIEPVDTREAFARCY